MKSWNKEAKDSSRQTPLHIAARSGHDAVVRLLAEQGANKEVKDITNGTPLHYAAAGGHRTVDRVKGKSWRRGSGFSMSDM